MSTVIIHKVGGGSFEIPEGNIENTRRLLGDKIAHIERKGEGQSLVEEIDESLIVEVTETETGETETTEVVENSEDQIESKPTLKELEGTDKDVLRSLADKIAKDKNIAKANARCGVVKLAKYVFDNQ